jgi:hypothetical protein
MIGLLVVLSWAVLLVDQVFFQAPQNTLDQETQKIVTTPATSVKKDAEGLDRRGAPALIAWATRYRPTPSPGSVRSVSGTGVLSSARWES